jgi:hypothetical protein
MWRNENRMVQFFLGLDAVSRECFPTFREKSGGPSIHWNHLTLEDEGTKFLRNVVTHRITRRHIPEDLNPQRCHCKNLKSRKINLLPLLDWTLGSQMGRKLMTTLGQLDMDPYITIGKAYLWAAIPRCFLPKWWLSWSVQNSSWLKILRGEEYTSALIAEQLWQHLRRLLPNHLWFGNVRKC